MSNKRLTTYVLWALIGLLMAACTKKEEDDIANLANDTESATMNDIRNPRVYEANWVYQQQVVDTTRLMVRNQFMSFTHLPNRLLLEPLLTDEQKNEKLTEVPEMPGEEVSAIAYRSEGHSASNSYMMLANPMDYILYIGKREYGVKLLSESYGVYDPSKDAWSIALQIRQVSLIDPILNDPLTGFNGTFTHDYDPPLELLLITAKRIK